MAQRRSSSARQAWLALVLAATASLEVLPLQVRAQARGGSRPATTSAPVADGLQLRVRRLPDAVELVLVDAGLGASLTQQPLGNQWLGELRTDRARSLKVGPQSATLPADGMERISFEGSGTSFRLTVTATAGRPLPQPVVSSDGRDLVVRFPAAPNVQAQTASPNLRQPSPVPTSSFVPPLRPRAVAPPVGDLAVGTMTLRNRGLINLSGPLVTLTTRNAPARDVLLTLARLGNYGFVYVEDFTPKTKFEDKEKPDSLASINQGSRESGFFIEQRYDPRPVTVHFVAENYERAFNSVLISAGWQARQEGRTILVGPNILRKLIGNPVSKVYRLNQISADSAADYLANLGSTVNKTNTTVTSVTAGGVQSQPQGAPNQATTTTGSETRIEAFGASTGPLVGLLATSDSRLGTITLVGEGDLVAVAEQYLKQLDLRQRQVALSVRILDVSLDNDNSIVNSFAFRNANTFILNDGGSLTATFGSANVTAGGLPNPGLAFEGTNFVDTLRAAIISRSTKLIASPTLILSENAERIRGGQEVAVRSGDSAFESGASIGRPFSNESFVNVGTRVITSFQVTAGQNGAENSCQPEFGTAGLTFGARISKIDDNGFVTFSLSPAVSAVTARENIENCGAISILSVRRVDTGSLRVRDGQTLVLTGVISDEVQSTVTKWPIVGDIPLIGQFFRGSGTQRSKRELIILVTPKIIDDEQGGAYGYGYRPSSEEARTFFNGKQ